MKLVMAAATDVGTVRETNEDFFYYSKPGQLIVVCDGMGGHQSGAIASRIAGKTMRDIFFHADFAELARLGEDVIDRLPPLALRLVIGARLANRRLLLTAERDRHLKGMGTTLLAMAFGENNACAVHIGDSRLYCLREKTLLPLTEDHSLVNQLLQDRDIRQDQVKQFRKKNVLTRALGTHPAMKVDAQWFPVQPSDMFLLCSDGFHNALSDEQIAALLRRKEPDLQKMIDTIVQQAKSANGSDNITAVIARVEKIAAAAEKKDKVKMTIAEEAARTMQFEDKFIQDKYIIEKSGGRLGQVKSKRFWRSWFVVLSGLMMATLAYAMINQTWLFEAKRENKPANRLIASPNLKAANELKAPNNPAPVIVAPPIGGYLMFLHVRDSQQLQSLRNQPGIRVLDQFNPDRATTTSRSRHVSRPLLTGAYSFAIFDSAQNFIYRKDDIHLQALPVIPDTARVTSTAAGAPTKTAAPNEMMIPSPNVSASLRNETTGNAKKDTSSQQQ